MEKKYNYLSSVSYKRKHIRSIEIVTGFFLLLSVLTLLAAYLIKFEYTHPNDSFQEDLEYLFESLSSQKLSSVMWMTAGTVYLFLLPVCLVFLSRYKIWINILSGLLILVMAWSFFSIGINEMNITRILSQFTEENISSAGQQSVEILPYLVRIKYYTKLGICAMGVFSILLVISRFFKVRLAIIGIGLTLAGSPLLTILVWVNEDHLLFTLALALSWSGMLVMGVKLMNYGMKIKQNADESV